MQRTHAGVLSFVAAIALVAAAVATFVYASTTSQIIPTSDGAYLQWSVTGTSTTHYTQVDETPCNGTTDYNFTSTVGNRDSYGVSLSSVPDGAQITQIDIIPCASRHVSGGAAPVMNVFYRLNGTDSSDKGSYALGGLTPTTLATSSWTGLTITKSGTTALQIGAVLTSGTKGARLSRIAAVITYTALTAPSSLSGTASTTSEIDLGWTDNSTTEDGFVIERQTGAGAFGSIATTAANIVSYQDTGLASNTNYSYRLRAYNAGGYSSYSNTASATTSASSAPAAPSSTTATATTTSEVGVSWTDNSSNEDSFAVERQTSGGAFSQIATTSANAAIYQDTGLAAGTTYGYRIRSYSAAGGYSSYSNTGSATTQSATPAAPSNLGATATTSSMVALNWTDNSSNEDSFDIQRKTGAGSFLHIATTTANVVSYMDKGLTASTTYSYRLRAYNATGGYSAFSNTATATTTP